MKRHDSGKQGSESNQISEDNVPSKYPLLRKRRRLIIITLDCYDKNGSPDKKMFSFVQELFKAIKIDPQIARLTGYAVSTAMPLSELTEFFKSGNLKINEFDVLICSSGSEVYYPGTYVDKNGKLYPDPDHTSHIEYRWGSEGLKKTISKLMSTSDGGQDKSGQSKSLIEEDKKSSNSHCLSYLIKDPSKAKKVDDLRQKLRMRGLRCHLMYCRNSSRMQVIPLLASRSQALRYLFVRWRLNVANMYVVLGETGDTDYEELISGTHKTLIIKGIVQKGSEELLRTAGSYQKDDIVPPESPLVTYISENASADVIANTLRKVSRVGI